ncbi:Ig-like domain-containing protein [Blastopirellula sp. J2-11]|uniref:Ig-like domain-containing protein n=1 Tax=Blastopirellula sp. J2-11 TaxID=2943192 RepID=UPI0021CA4FFC|nr:Ig-like domain-containing protein [Blastopirellula sp. J2-11]UUO04657.1 Ig-like domain-containing protein [Blastopirellula sp. J2-11]
MKAPIALIVLATIALVGCGPGANSDLGEVKGLVKLDGSPLPNAQVQFQPTQGRPSYGLTDANGVFELQYTGTAAGALIGSHRVLVSTAISQENGQTAPELVPAKYNSKSDLQKEVQPGVNEYEFDLVSR